MTGTDDEAKDALAKLGVGPAAAELYADLLRPAARELGSNLRAVAKLVTAALAPLHGLVWGIDRVRDWLSVALLQRLASVPPENIQPPNPNVAGQAMLQLSFCADEEHLRELYANLLAAAMNKSTASAVHPAFVHVIQQLSSDEALLLQLVSRERKALTMGEETSDAHYDPNADSISAQFRSVCETAGVAEPSQSDSYLDNLVRLRILLEITYTEGKLHGGQAVWDAPDTTLENKTGRIIEISSFGEKFLSVCVRPRDGNLAG